MPNCSPVSIPSPKVFRNSAKCSSPPFYGFPFLSFFAMTFTSDSFLTLSDAEFTLLVSIAFSLDPFEHGEADFSSISHDAPGF